MPVLRRNTLHPQPRCLHTLDDLLRQRTLLQVRQILLQMPRAAGPHDDCVVQLRPQQRVMLQPAQRDFRVRQAVPRRHGVDALHRVEVGVVPVAAAVHGALHDARVEARAWLERRLVARVSPRQQPAGQRLEGVQREAVVPQTRQQLRLDAALQRVVDALVHGRPDPAVPVTDLADPRHLPRHVVADPEAREVTLFVQPVHLAQRVLQRGLPVRAVEVEHVDAVGLQRLETLHQPAADVLGVMSVRASGRVDRRGQSRSGVELRVHDQAATLPFQAGEHFLGRAAAVETRRVDFSEPVLLEDVEDAGGVVEVVDAGAEGVYSSVIMQQAERSIPTYWACQMSWRQRRS